MVYTKSHRVQETIDTFVPDIIGDIHDLRDIISDVIQLRDIVEMSKETASKKTHYHGLNEWSTPINRFIHRMLKKYKFVNGGAAMGIEQNPDASLWWNICGLINNICYSPNIPKEDCAIHHTSAWARNEAMFIDLGIIINEITIKNNGK